MKGLFLMIAGITLGSVARADLQKICYTTDSNGQFCTTDNLGKVQVYIYAAGWCPSCNDEADQMPAVYNDFQGQNVVFANLLGQNDDSQAPDQAFLQDWRQRHSLPSGFVVAGKYDDFGTAFNPPGYVPYTVILDAQGNVAKSGDLEPSDIESEVRSLLGSNKH
jgi:peroxiredoxin